MKQFVLVADQNARPEVIVGFSNGTQALSTSSSRTAAFNVWDVIDPPNLRLPRRKARTVCRSAGGGIDF